MAVIFYTDEFCLAYVYKQDLSGGALVFRCFRGRAFGFKFWAICFCIDFTRQKGLIYPRCLREVRIFYMNRNVSIVVVVLVLVVIAGYLVWLRSRYQPVASPNLYPEVTATPTSSPVETATSSATPEATGSMKEKTSTGSSVGR